MFLSDDSRGGPWLVWCIPTQFHLWEGKMPTAVEVGFCQVVQVLQGPLVSR